MKITIKATGLYLTPAFKEYVENKLKPLHKFFTRVKKNGDPVVLKLEVARTTKHHQKGEVYYAEATLDMPGAVLRAEAPSDDVRLAVNEMKKKLTAEIKKHQTKHKDKKRETLRHE
ncbi:MAG TPA: ribosome-associated translation inhibitor RaiA [Candidatus Paceibacterota bacterium]